MIVKDFLRRFSRALGGQNFEVPIFILGAPRSGTTILNINLCQGDAHRYFPECNTISQSFYSLAAAKNLKDDRLAEYYGSYASAVDIYKKHIVDQINSLTRNEPYRKYVVLKDPYLAQKPWCILDIFPDAVILLAYRHPAETLGSAGRVAGVAKPDIAAYKPFYSGMSWLASRHKELPNLHVLYYEDIMQSPERMMSALSGLLGYDATPPVSPPESLKHSAFSTDRLFRPLGAGPDRKDSPESVYDPAQIEEIYGREIGFFDRHKAHFNNKLFSWIKPS